MTTVTKATPYFAARRRYGLQLAGSIDRDLQELCRFHRFLQRVSIVIATSIPSDRLSVCLSVCHMLVLGRQSHI